jgi:hypothetical protein
VVRIFGSETWEPCQVKLAGFTISGDCQPVLPNDITYYRQRADEEQAAAQQAGDPAIAQIHYDMARRYRDMLCEDASAADPMGGAIAGAGTVLA